MNINIEYIYKNPKVNKDIFLKTTVNDDIKINYSVFLNNGYKLNTPYEEKPFYFKELGYSCDSSMNKYNNGTIIKGLDKVILNLSLGDMIRVEIPYKYAYGKKRLKNIIDPKTNLIYYLRIIYISRGNNYYKCNNLINFKNIIKVDNIDLVKKEINKLDLENETYIYG